MDITIADCFAITFAFSILYDILQKGRQEGYKLTYRDYISIASSLTLIVGAACYEINDHVANGTLIGYTLIFGAFFMVAYFSLSLADTISTARAQLKLGHARHERADKAYHWIILWVAMWYIVFVMYYVFLQDNGSRVDLIIATTLGLCLSLFCIEKSRQQQSRENTPLIE